MKFASLNRNAIKSAIVLGLVCIVLSVSAQDRREDFNFWMLGAGGGATLFFGDISNDVDNPFSKYFTVQQGWAGSMSLHKRVLPYLAFNVQGTYGTWQGQRTQWSNDAPVSLEFNSKMTEVQLNTEVNLLNLINPKPRFVNFYVKGGVGYTLYNATKSDFKTNIVANTAKGGVFVVPWGFGGRLDFNERWGFYGETTFNHAFGDDLDAHDSKWTDVNDIYTFTSFGFTYKIYARDKKPVIEEIDIVDPIDTTVAEASLAPINIKVKVPRTVEPGASFTMKIQIDKDLRNEAAKLQQTLPLGFSATERVSEGGLFQFKDQISNISWTSLPKTPETLFIEYGVMVADDVDEKTYVIPGILFYTENGEERMHQFKLELKVERPVVAEEKPETNDEGSQSNNADIKTTEPETNSASNNDNGIVFRVQVKAIYGGKSSPELIRKKYGLDTEVHEDYHNGYMKYSTGNYGSYQDAALLKQQLREKGINGAFVVAFKDGKRISNIQEAIRKSKQVNTSKNTRNNSGVSTAAKPGVSYRIQVAASSRDFSADYIKNTYGLTKEVNKEKHNGLNKYTVGNYNNFDEAKTDLSNVRSRVKDAFIVKYTNGKR